MGIKQKVPFIYTKYVSALVKSINILFPFEARIYFFVVAFISPLAKHAHGIYREFFSAVKN